MCQDKPEIFGIPFEGKVIIYAPLKRLAFIGNEVMEESDFRYGIRMTVTPESVDTLPEAVMFITEHTRVKRVQVEPAFPCGRGEDVASGGVSSLRCAARSTGS